MSEKQVSLESGKSSTTDVTGITPAQLSAEDEELERRAVRKIDWTVLPVMTMFYLLSFLDRVNIGSARVAGLQKDLGLTDKQYQIVVTALFVPYIASELPSNLILKKIGPQILMPTILTVWGVIVTLQGLITSYEGLLVARIFLGAVEGPMFPGIVLYLSGFYTRKDLALRVAMFFSAASLSGAFAGLLAAAIQQMDGVGGKRGWAWIFILEGLFTVIFGVAGFFIVPKTPRHVSSLTERERDLIMARLERDRPFLQPKDKFSYKEILRALASPQVIIVFIMFFISGTMLFGLALFLPSIVSQLGFSRNRSQLLSVGPFAVGFVVTLFAAFWSDKYRTRGIPVALISLLAIAGNAVNLVTTDRYTSYGALFLMVPGVYAAPPILAAWMSNNSEPYYRRATSIAVGFMATNVGGILSTWRYPTKEGPRFRNTTIMSLTFSILLVVFSLTNMAYLHWQNTVKRNTTHREKVLSKYRSQNSLQRGGENEKDGKDWDENNLEAWLDLGDKHPDYHYTL